MRRVLPVLLLLLVSGAPALAGDEPTPAQAYEAKVKSLPAPSREAGFVFRGVMRLNGKRAGHAKLSAQPSEAKDGSVRWLTKDAMMIKLQAMPMLRVATAEFDQTLTPVAGVVRSVGMGMPLMEWKRTETGVTIVMKQEAEDGTVTPSLKNLEFTGRALTTMSATILFCRQVLDKPATYATRVLNITDAATKGEPLAEAVTLEFEGLQKMDGGHEVLAVKGTKGKETLALLFDPKTKQPIALRLDDGKRKIEILRGDEWTLPAETREAAALRTAFALGTGNVDILDDVTHWPTMYREAMAARGTQVEDLSGLDEFRNAVLAGWRKGLPKNPAEMIKNVLKMMGPQVKYEEKEGGKLIAVFPEMFKGVKIGLLNEGGIWYATSFEGGK